MVNQQIFLPMIPDSAPIVVNISQNDFDATSYAGRLFFNLINNGVAYDMNGATAIFQGEKPDGTSFAYPATVVNQSVVRVNVRQQMTVVAGRVVCQLVLSNTEGQIGSFNIWLEVQPSGTAGGDPSQTDIPALIAQAKEYADEAEQSAQDAAAWSAHPPYIGANGNWFIYDTGTDAFVDSGVYASGSEGNRWYTGTAVYGKDVNPTVFPTGIALAREGDMYLNISEGAVYHCTLGGDDTVAKWVYDLTLTGGGGGTSDYTALTNKPQINGETLIGNKTGTTLGLQNINLSVPISMLSGTAATVEQALQYLETDKADTTQLTPIVTDIDALKEESNTKNVMPNEGYTNTHGGVTYTVNVDGSVTTSGTSTENSYANIYYKYDVRSMAGKSFIFSGCPAGGNQTSGYCMIFQVYDSTNSINTTWYDEGNGVTVNIPNNLSNVSRINVYIMYAVAGLSANQTFYPMLRDVNETDATYVPHILSNYELTKSCEYSTPQDMIAYVEPVSYMSKAHPTGDVFISNNKLYKALADIPAVAGNIQEGTNCVALPPIAEQINKNVIYGNIEATATLSGWTLIKTIPIDPTKKYLVIWHALFSGTTGYKAVAFTYNAWYGQVGTDSSNASLTALWIYQNTSSIELCAHSVGANVYAGDYFIVEIL